MWLSVLFLELGFIVLYNSYNISNILEKKPKLQMRRCELPRCGLAKLSLSALAVTFPHLGHL